MKIAASLFCALVLGTPAAAEELAPAALNSFTTAPAKIANAPVLDQSGKEIGKVKAVVTDQDGRPSALSFVAKDGAVLKIVAAPAVSYDGQSNVVVADAAQAQPAPGDQVALN